MASLSKGPSRGNPQLRSYLTGEGVSVKDGKPFQYVAYTDVSASLDGLLGTTFEHGFDTSKWNSKTFDFVEKTVQELYKQAGRENEFKGVSLHTADQMPSHEKDKLPIENAAWMAKNFIELKQSLAEDPSLLSKIRNHIIDVTSARVVGPAEQMGIFGIHEPSIKLPEIPPQSELGDALRAAASTDKGAKGSLLALSGAVQRFDDVSDNDELRNMVVHLRQLEKSRPNGLVNPEANAALNGIRELISEKIYQVPIKISEDDPVLLKTPGARFIPEQRPGGVKQKPQQQPRPC